MKKLFFTLLALITTILSSFSVNSDYKNNLMKIDIVKMSNNEYRVDLYTQKPYLAPVKVIKKNGLNTYIKGYKLSNFYVLLHLQT